MHINVKFTKVKSTKNDYDLEARAFSRIFYIGKTIILILDKYVLVGSKKIDVEVVYASRNGNVLKLCSKEATYILNFSTRTILKESSVETSQVKDTPWGNIIIGQEKILLGEKEVVNELAYGDDDSTPFYYCTTFDKYILMASSNNSNVFFYDKDLQVIDMEGGDFVYVQADEEDNQLYIRGMDYSQGCLVVVDLKGNITEYSISGIDRSNEEMVEEGPFKCESDCGIEEVKAITDQKEEIKTGIPKPTLSLSHLTEDKKKNNDTLSNDTLKNDTLKNDTLSNDTVNNDTLKNDTLKDSLKLDSLSFSLVDSGGKNIFSTSKSEDSYKTNIFNQKKIEREIPSTPSKTIASQGSPSSIIEGNTKGKSIDNLNSLNITPTFGHNISSISERNLSSTVDKSIFNTNGKCISTTTQSLKGISPKDTTDTGGNNIFNLVDKGISTATTEGNVSTTTTARNISTNTIGRNISTNTIGGNIINTQPLKACSQKPTNPSLNDSVQDIISDILSLEVNKVQINHYKTNSTTDRVERELYKSMSTLKRVDDLKREMESSLLCMINTIDHTRLLSIEDSLRYFDEVIERKIKIKTPLVYNTPLLSPTLKKSQGVELPDLNVEKNILTKINLEPEYLIERITLGYKKREEPGVESSRVGDAVNLSISKECSETAPKEPVDNPVANEPVDNPVSVNIPVTNPAVVTPEVKPVISPTPVVTPAFSFNQSTPTSPFSNSSDIFNRVLGSSIPVIKKEEEPKKDDKPPSAFSRFASSHNLFK